MEQEVYQGEVEWFNADRGFGFINWYKDGKKQDDMFVHFSDLLMEGYKQLKPGQIVSFIVGENHHGRPKAIEVEILK